MHVVYVHKNFPAQFGHIGQRLVEQHGFRCSFVTEKEGPSCGVERIVYHCRGGATHANHVASRFMENFAWRRAVSKLKRN